jgi:hypothetical protein
MAASVSGTTCAVPFFMRSARRPAVHTGPKPRGKVEERYIFDPQGSEGAVCIPRVRHAGPTRCVANGKARHDYEYERDGVANLFMVFAPLEGQGRGAPRAPKAQCASNGCHTLANEVRREWRSRNRRLMCYKAPSVHSPEGTATGCSRQSRAATIFTRRPTRDRSVHNPRL